MSYAYRSVWLFQDLGDILVESNRRIIEIDKLQKELSQALNKKVDVLNEKTILLPTIKQMILKSAINV